MAITKLSNPTRYKVKVFMGWNDNGGRIDKTKIVHGSKREAERVERELKTLKDKGKVDKSTETLNQHIPKWLRSIRHKVKESSLEAYEGRLKRVMASPLGVKELKKIKIVDIEEFFNTMYDEGYADMTVQLFHTPLKTCLDDAVIKGKITFNPMTYYRLPRRAQRGNPKAFTLQEIERFVEAAKSTDHYLFYCLMLFAGLRPCEVAGLTWQYVNLEEGYIKVEKTIIRKNAKNWKFDTPKTRKSKRTIAIGSFLIDLLTTHKLNSPINSYDLVLTNDLLEPICTKAGITSCFKKIVKVVDLPTYPLYSLRATHLTHFEHVAGIQATSRRAGHSSVQITSDHYLSPQLEHEKIAVAEFEAKLLNHSNFAKN